MSSVFCNFKGGLCQKEKDEIVKEIDLIKSVYDVRPRNRGYKGDFDLWVYVNYPKASWITLSELEAVAEQIRKIQGIDAGSLTIVI